MYWLPSDNSSVKCGKLRCARSLQSVGKCLMVKSVLLISLLIIRILAAVTGMVAGLAPKGTIFETAAQTGASLFGAGASAMNAAAQTGISMANAAENAKLDAIKAGVSAGTGLAGTGINGLIGVKEGLVNTGLRFGEAGAGMAGSAMDVGFNTMNNLGQSIGSLANRVSAASNNIAARAMGSLHSTTPSG